MYKPCNIAFGFEKLIVIECRMMSRARPMVIRRKEREAAEA